LAGIPISPTGVWRIDTSHTQVGFSLTHLGISTVHGLFAHYSGHATIGPDPESSSVEVTASTNSINTGNSWRDEHLLGADFLDADRFPELTFRSTAIVPAGDRYTLDGDLTIKGISKRVPFDLMFNGTNVYALDEKTHAGFLATAVILRSEFDVGYGVPIASDEVRLRIDAQLIAPDESSIDLSGTLQ
jgi:polyisoprenoid-binding protein YceI